MENLILLQKSKAVEYFSALRSLPSGGYLEKKEVFFDGTGKGGEKAAFRDTQ